MGVVNCSGTVLFAGTLELRNCVQYATQELRGEIIS